MLILMNENERNIEASVNLKGYTVFLQMALHFFKK